MKKMNKNNFIQLAREIHRDKYDYSKVVYKNSKEKVLIICPIHGEFWQSPYSHLKSTGCLKCARRKPYKPVVEGVNRKQMKEYSIWRAIKSRTTNPNTDDYNRYMGRGICCCNEWINSFETFYKDMGPCPEGYSIDRIDPNGDYCKENCRWANSVTQSQNRGDFNLLFTYNGETHVLKEWSRILNIKYTTLYNRITKSNMSFEEAINYKKPLFEFNGEEKTLKEWAAIYNIKYQTVVNRLRKHHWTLEEALTVPFGQKRNI